MTQKEFIDEFQSLANRVEEDNKSFKYHKYGVDTPAYALVSYMSDCLTAFIKVVEAQHKYQNRHCIENDAERLPVTSK